MREEKQGEGKRETLSVKITSSNGLSVVQPVLLHPWSSQWWGSPSLSGGATFILSKIGVSTGCSQLSPHLGLEATKAVIFLPHSLYCGGFCLVS